MKANDAYPLLDHWVSVIKDLFPTDARLDTHSTIDDARIDIDWTVASDGASKYRRLVVVFSRNAVADYQRRHSSLKPISDAILHALVEDAAHLYNRTHNSYDAAASPFSVDVTTAVLNAPV